MLRSLGGGSKLTLGRKHRTVGRLWFPGTEFNSWQHNHSRQHRHPTSRYNADQSWIHISGDFSEYHGPRLYFSQWSARCHDAGNDQPGLDFSGWNARRDHSRFDIAEWHAEYNHPGIDIAEWQPEHDDSRLNVAQRYSEYDNARINVAQWNAEHNDARLNVAQWNAEHNDARLNVAQWNAEHNDARLNVAEWNAEYDDSRVNLAQRCAEHDYATNHASGYHATFNNSAWQFIHHRRDQ